jgi:glutamate synthase domain-containing protein 2
VLSITGGFQAPADIVEAAGLGAESAPVAKPNTRSKTPAAEA